MYQFFYPLSLFQHENIAVNKCQLQFSKEGNVLPYTGVGKPLYDNQTTVEVTQNKNCYFHSIVTCSQDPKTRLLPLGKCYVNML